MDSYFESLYSKETSWQSSEIPLGTDVRSWSEDDMHILLFGEIEELWEIFGWGLEVEHVFLDFMVVPHDVDAEGIETHGFDHLYSVLPVLRDDSGVVDLS